MWVTLQIFEHPLGAHLQPCPELRRRVSLAIIIKHAPRPFPVAEGTVNGTVLAFK